MFTVGCTGTTATIRRTDGPPIEAEIDSSDASMIRLRGERDYIRFLEQRQVSSIDHPGNVGAVLGGAFAVGGGLMTLLWLDVRRAQEASGNRGNGFDGMLGFMAIGGIVLGLVTLAPNLFVWARSKSRARAFEDARPPESMIPPPVPGEVEILGPPASGEDLEKDGGRFHR